MLGLINDLQHHWVTFLQARYLRFVYLFPPIRLDYQPGQVLLGAWIIGAS